MNPAEFHELVVDETSLAIAVDDLKTPLDELPGWDSVYMLKLITAIEQRTGKPVSVSALLDARSLDDVRQAVAA
ncbi:conserved hypothetical protein [Segniliparus rotundus DSM 44985]|uniref:Carrier domain-containing protein n=1 Tax=Segniliparus rotundus (strain ATCC BAA-972 / CDC 1076 / CIP 108378 / DSM 44985 / JCM 13578) TaxID=640132 RepID=D6ZEG4_SEGRD|nr:acyl carrier protein [Segniliparus rotundus]ADG99440.1 conserved hypothetical protein [Segniliparus rotundus DSM 44985]